MEIHLTNLRAYDSECIGCRRHNKDIMISFEHNGEFYDIFMNQTDAETFAAELAARLADNEVNEQ